MQDLHWRWNFNTQGFEFIENDPRQHYEPLLRHVAVPTLVIDINLVRAADLRSYADLVVDSAQAAGIRYDQIIFDGTQDPVFGLRCQSSHARSVCVYKRYSDLSGLEPVFSEHTPTSAGDQLSQLVVCLQETDLDPLGMIEKDLMRFHV